MLRFRVWDLRLRALDLGFGIEGRGFRILFMLHYGHVGDMIVNIPQEFLISGHPMQA